MAWGSPVSPRSAVQRKQPAEGPDATSGHAAKQLASLLTHLPPNHAEGRTDGLRQNLNYQDDIRLTDGSQ